MRLPGAVSRLAAPFFGSQAEPSSRRRWRSRVVWWCLLAFGVILLLVRRYMAYVWCHFELLGSFTLHSCIIAGAELHLFLDSIFYIAGLF